MNPLYCGTFNYQREKHEEWVRATSREQAFNLLCARLGVKLGKTGHSVRQYFLSRAHSYDIKEVKEDGNTRR